MGTPELVGGVTFLAVVLLVVGPYLLFVVRPESAQRNMLRQRIKTGGAAHVGSVFCTIAMRF